MLSQLADEFVLLPRVQAVNLFLSNLREQVPEELLHVKLLRHSNGSFASELPPDPPEHFHGESRLAQAAEPDNGQHLETGGSIHQPVHDASRRTIDADQRRGR